MPLPVSNISSIPAFDVLQSITTSNSVGPRAANRQPNQLSVRTDAIRTPTNELIDAVNYISLGASDLKEYFLPRAVVSRPMLVALDMGSFKINNLASGALASDAINKGQLDAAVLSANTSAILRNGTQAPTADVGWGGYKLTNLGNATADGDAISRGFARTNFVRKDNSGVEVMTGRLAIADPDLTVDSHVPNMKTIRGTQVLASSGSVIPNYTLGPIMYLLLTGNVSLSVPTDMPDGSVAILYIKQAVGTNYVVTLSGTGWKESIPYITTTADNGVDILTIIRLAHLSSPAYFVSAVTAF